MSRESYSFISDNNNVDLYDIRWLMGEIDIDAVLDQLGVEITSHKGEWYWGYCPDHSHFVGKEPSHPKWSINIETGFTKCFTEPRVSNLVFTASRLKNISPIKVAEWLLGHSTNSVEAKCSRLKKMIDSVGLNKHINSFDILKYKSYIENGTLGSNSISFLAKHNILPETAKTFRCVEFSDGPYRDRLIHPIYNENKQIQGFVATDVLGEEQWLKKNPTVIDSKTKILRKTTDDDYKKVLYPKGFKIGNYLSGIDTFKIGDIAILVEGVRDMMKLRQEGFSGSLGIGGVNLSSHQLELLAKKAPKKLMVMLDDDSGGESGTKNIVERCLEFYTEVFIIHLTNGKNPKDLSREEILFHMRNKTERIYRKQTI